MQPLLIAEFKVLWISESRKAVYQAIATPRT
jgi:hypothetical protein